jgi:hypothetical protein
LQLKNYLANQREMLFEKFEFKPKLNVKSHALAEKFGKDVVERSANWIELKKERLDKKTAEIRAAEEHKILETMHVPRLPTAEKNIHVMPKVKVYIDSIPKTAYQQHTIDKQTKADEYRHSLERLASKGLSKDKSLTNPHVFEERAPITKSPEKAIPQKLSSHPRPSRSLSDFLNLV